jgi:uncharacterized protein (TIGR03435 family)
MLLRAFPIQEAQLVGGPGWLDTDRFDVVAKAGKATSDDDLRVMLQNLLIERFSIKLHVETRSLPIYALVRAREDGRLGPDLHVAGCEGYSSGPGPCGTPGSIERHPGELTHTQTGRSPAGRSMAMRGATMPALASSLSAMLNRPVVDRTGLDGRFELALRYTMPGGPATAASDPAEGAPDLFTAVDEQLGLKLEATRGPVDVLVIDGAEHPKNDDFEMPTQ